MRALFPTALLVLALSLTAAAQLPAPDISGTWRLDRDLTTEDLSRIKTDTLVIRQSDGGIHFAYFDREERPLGVEEFTTDWTERPRYTTRIERAYARVRWDKNELLVSTRSFLDAQGYQVYYLVDRWELSPDRKTLIDKSSDGKVMVYNKVELATR